MAKISFVMPTHNRDDLIGESIQSVVDQTYNDWELIVVDDHSDPGDKTEEIIKKFSDSRIKYFKLPDLNGRGVSCGRNFGNLKATSEIIAVCDSDDVNDKDRAKHVLESYQDEKWDVFYGKYLVFSKERPPHPVTGNPQIPFNMEEFKKRNFIPNSSSAYTKNIAMHYPYNSSLNVGEDYDFFTRIAADGKKFYFCPETIYHYRFHPGAITAGIAGADTTEQIRKYRGWI